jgi:transposase
MHNQTRSSVIIVEAADMQAPLLVRPLTADERQILEGGLRSSDAFILRRCQILLASARGEHAPAIAQSLGCDSQTVRNTIHAFHTDGRAALERASSRPHTVHAAFDAAGVAGLRELLHQSPRDCGHATSLWTLDLLAEEAFRQGLSDRRVTGETVRATFERHGIRWQRAKGWICSPDPQYAQKNGSETG